MTKRRKKKVLGLTRLPRKKKEGGWSKAPRPFSSLKGEKKRKEKKIQNTSTKSCPLEAAYPLHNTKENRNKEWILESRSHSADRKKGESQGSKDENGAAPRQPRLLRRGGKKRGKRQTQYW